jgi:hypothetical protein
VPAVPNPLAEYLINPTVRVTVVGYGMTPTESDLVFTAGSDDDPYISFEIEKDREEEPNEATFSIFNLSPETRKRFIQASNEEAPVTIELSKDGEEDTAVAFRGEIDSAHNFATRPGHETRVRCLAQRKQHHAFYIDKKTYAAGTPKAQIIMDLIDAIGLPYEIPTLPVTTILLSQSFNGPAFPLLEKFVFDQGMYCFINDGVLKISSIYVPQNPTPKIILSSDLLGTPEETEISDETDVLMRTVTETVTVNPLARQRKKKKKRVKIDLGGGQVYWMKVQGKTVADAVGDYIEYEAVDNSIPGMNFWLRCQPDIQPDDIVMFPDVLDIATTMFSVREVLHTGDTETFDDFSTELTTSVYDPTGGDLLAGIV